MDTETTDQLIVRLAVLTAEAHEKAKPDAMDAEYWNGVVFGLETALVELRLAIEKIGTPSTLSISEASIESMESTLDEGDYP